MEGKGACKSWQVFKSNLFLAQEWSVPITRKRNRLADQFNRELMTVSMQKQYTAIRERYSHIAQTHRDGVRKAKACLQLILARDIKHNKNF